MPICNHWQHESFIHLAESALTNLNEHLGQYLAAIKTVSALQNVIAGDLLYFYDQGAESRPLIEGYLMQVLLVPCRTALVRRVDRFGMAPGAQVQEFNANTGIAVVSITTAFVPRIIVCAHAPAVRRMTASATL